MYYDMFGQAWPDLIADKVYVCLTHNRFIPCRRCYKNDDCNWSCLLEDIKKVQDFQNAERA